MAQNTRDPTYTDRIIREGRVLVKAIEWHMTRMLLDSHKQRLRPLVEMLPGWCRLLWKVTDFG
jgi:hypothetical protein